MVRCQLYKITSLFTGSLLSNGGGVTGVESLQHPGHAPGHALYSEQQQPHHPPFFVPAMAALGAQSGMASPGPDEGSRWAANVGGSSYSLFLGFQTLKLLDINVSTILN